MPIKRIFALLLLFLAFTLDANAVIVCVGGGAGCTSTTRFFWNAANTTTACVGTTTSPSYTATARNTVFILAHSTSDTTGAQLTFSDSTNDTCVVVKKFAGTIVGDQYVGMCKAVTGGSTTFNLVGTGGSGHCAVAGALLEVSGLGSSPTEDVDSTTGTGHVAGNGQSLAATTISGTTANTTAANEIAFAVAQESGQGISSGPTLSFNDINQTTFTSNGAIIGALSAYEIVSSLGNWHTTWTPINPANADAGVLTMQFGGLNSVSGGQCNGGQFGSGLRACGDGSN